MEQVDHERGLDEPGQHPMGAPRQSRRQPEDAGCPAQPACNPAGRSDEEGNWVMEVKVDLDNHEDTPCTEGQQERPTSADGDELPKVLRLPAGEHPEREGWDIDQA